MPSCIYRKDQPDGLHGWCEHPDARKGDTCILNTGDECVIRVPVITSMQVTKDNLDRLRAFGYPANKALEKVLDIAESI